MERGAFFVEDASGRSGKEGAVEQWSGNERGAEESENGAKRRCGGDDVSERGGGGGREIILFTPRAVMCVPCFFAGVWHGRVTYFSAVVRSAEGFPPFRRGGWSVFVGYGWLAL